MNTTFRQVGIATSVAALGTLLAHRMAGPPSRATFGHAIDRLFTVSAAIAVVAGVLTFALVRQRDFVQTTPGPRLDVL
jgi:hypothetical protein